MLKARPSITRERTRPVYGHQVQWQTRTIVFKGLKTVDTDNYLLTLLDKITYLTIQFALHKEAVIKFLAEIGEN